MEGGMRLRGLGCQDTRLVTHLWVNTFPELGRVCLLAFPKEHRLRKGFKTSPYQGDTTELCHWAGATLLPICMKGRKEEGMTRPRGESYFQPSQG